ncbi:MAG: HlyD family efflux transporter periplasmic adaptor subunit [Candidatus Adiutrix sp.]|jgi:membrane fusion protein (multidrug efflux system)|nr:HlyD family efflux transporter periplasmic adaptor subunit [Candidatus Adiutrix sp.]
MFQLAAGFAGLGLLWAGYWFFFQKGLESTDNAYLAGNQIRVTPLVAGTVREILTDSTEMVRAGQVLVRLDPTDAFLGLEKARSNLASAVREQAGLAAGRDRLKALIEMREKELNLNRADYERRLKLRAGVSVTEEEVNTYRQQAAIAEAALRAARHELEATERLLSDTPLADQPAVRQSADQLREAWLAWRRCEIKSPAGGRVARRTVQVGSRVEPGGALMAVVPEDEIWVEANFKEVQLRRMKVGQPARLTVDLLGRGLVYQGRVTGFSPGTGSAFSLLPPENATGNWIKVVQRVPVKIDFTGPSRPAGPLLLGLSCRVEVEVDQEGRPLPDPGAPEARYLARGLDEDLAPVDLEIAGIIAANSGPEAPAAREGRPR